VLTDLLRRLLADPDWLRRLDRHAAAALKPTSLDTNAGARLAMVLESAVNDAGDSLHNMPEIVEALALDLIESDLIWDAEFFDVLEYGRTMHAEMDAITSAARKGVSLRNATLYCTTLPCHECARLIIGAGIRRVIFIEPYEKSRIEEMYDSEINFTTLADSRRSERAHRKGDLAADIKQVVRVDFVPYVGVSPRRFHELFAFVPRKLEDQEGQPRRLSGKKAVWTKAKSEIRETIISGSAVRSLARLEDLRAHEAELIKQFEDDVDGIEV
jgi:deoxycytidylate deaminase